MTTSYDTWFFSSQDKNIREYTSQEEKLEHYMDCPLAECRKYCNANYWQDDDYILTICSNRISAHRKRLRGDINAAMLDEVLIYNAYRNEMHRIEEENEFNDMDNAGVLDF